MKRLCLAVGVLLAGVFVAANDAHAYSLKNTKTGHRVHWTNARVQLTVDPKLKQTYGADEMHSALTIATEAWRGLPNVPDLEIAAGDAPGYDANVRTNGIYLLKPWPFAKEQLAVTVSTYDMEGVMIGADVLVNGEAEYTLLVDDDDHPGMVQHDLAAVLTHEMGHVLGLDEDLDDQTATMWPYIHGGDTHQRTLAEDDEMGVTEAYRGVTFEAAGGGCTQASVVGRSAGSDLPQWFCLMVGFAWSARRYGSRRGSLDA